MNDTMGFLYIATGEDFVEEARISAKTVNRQHQDIPICLITDVKITDDVFDEVIRLENPAYGFEDQIYNLDRTPFDRTIYLDTDIYADGSVADVFDLLDQFDMAVTHNHDGKAWPVEGVPESFPEFNTGVIAYRLTNQFRSLLTMWEDVYIEKKQTDETVQNQPTFRQAVYESDIRFATLRQEYNCAFWTPGYAVGEVKLFHGRLQSVNGPGAGEYFDAETAVKIINQTKEPRTYTQLGGLTLHTNKTDSLIHRARLSYRKHGIKHVFCEGIKLIRKSFSHILSKNKK
jgi:hypothetical protein